MTARYELRKNGLPGREIWHFVLKSPDGQTLAISEFYASRSEVLGDFHVRKRQGLRFCSARRGSCDGRHPESTN